MSFAVAEGLHLSACACCLGCSEAGAKMADSSVFTGILQIFLAFGISGAIIHFAAR